MSDLESLTARQSSFATFLRAQLPLLAGSVFVSLEGAIALPYIVGTASAVIGVAVVVAASILMVALPWDRWPSMAMITIPLLDVIGVAFLRLAYIDDLPTVSILTVFPVVWLAYAFRRSAIGLAILGALFITVLPVIVGRSVPTSPLEIASIVTLPLVVTGLAVAVGEAGRQLEASQMRLHEANSEMKTSLARAEDTQALTQILLETADVAIAFYDTDRRLVMANTRAKQAVAAAGFSLDHEPYAGLEVRRANNVDQIPFEEQIIPRALRGDLENHQMEWIGPQGQQIAVTASSAQVTRADGSLWGTLIAVHDVTDLARSLQVKDEFIATVSHELRTPLTSIIGYLEVLTEELEESDEFVTSSLAASTRNALRLQARIQELLETAEQRQALAVKNHDLAALLERAIDTHAKQADAAGISVASSIARPLLGRFDEDRIEQVVDNLLSNAIKYAPGATVTVGGHETDGGVIIEVADTGRGMSPDETAQAFDTFWRAGDARRSAVQGIGIGLSLTRRLVEAHHGSIRIDSERGRGTTVTVFLPTAG